jgi:orotate phosphoribosyltransferase/predicted amidohydrolase
LLSSLQGRAIALASDLGLADRLSGLDPRKALADPSSDLLTLVSQGWLTIREDSVCPGFLLRLTQVEAIPDDAASLLRSDIFGVLCDSVLEGCVRISPEKKFSLLHAEYSSSLYFDCDRLYVADNPGRNITVDLARWLCQLMAFDLLASTIPLTRSSLLGAYPLAFHLSMILQKSVFTTVQYQDATKHLGAYEPTGARALIVQDVLTTGRSVVNLGNALRESGNEVVGALVIFDRSEGGGDLLREHGIPHVSLLSFAGLRRHYQKKAVGRTSNANEGITQKASMLLDVVPRFRFTSVDCQSELKQDVRIGLVVRGLPPMEWLDGDFHFISPDQAAELVRSSIRSALEAGCDAVFLPELTVPYSVIDWIADYASATGMLICGGLEYDKEMCNKAFIAVGGKIYTQAKIVRSPYDSVAMEPGDSMLVLKNTVLGNMALLICADLFDYELAARLKECAINTVAVISRNRAVETFRDMTLDRALGLHAMVVVVNDADFGPSAIQAPVAGPGKEMIFEATSSDTLKVRDVQFAALRAGKKPFLKNVDPRTG